MRMTISFPGGRRVDAEFDGLRIATDQPVEHGGAGSAPAPFDHFLASIGTCAGLYALRFLEQRDLPTEGLSIELETRRDPETRLVAEIVLRVDLPPGFPEKYRNAIVNAIGLCSVKKHLERPPRFTTELRDAQVAALTPAERTPAGTSPRG